MYLLRIVCRLEMSIVYYAIIIIVIKSYNKYHRDKTND